MEIKTPVAATVLAALVGHIADGFAGWKLIPDPVPATVLSAAVASSTATVAQVNGMVISQPSFFNTTTDELIEAPVFEMDKITQSSSSTGDWSALKAT
jgi:hypothetical protein